MQRKGLVFGIAILALILSLPLAAAQEIPEELESFIYGIAIEPEGTPEEGLNLTVQWEDSFGVVWVARIQTMSPEEALELNLTGESVYDGGYMDSQGGSSKVITGEGISIELKANPVEQEGGEGTTGTSGTSPVSQPTQPSEPTERPTLPVDGGDGTDTPSQPTEDGSGDGESDVSQQAGTSGQNASQVTEEGTEEETGEKKRPVRSAIRAATSNPFIVLGVMLAVAAVAGGGLYITREREEKKKSFKPERISVTDLMKKEVPAVKSEDRVERAIHLLVTEQITSLPVLEGSNLVGLITASDVLKNASEKKLKDLKAKKIMSEPMGVSADSNLLEAIESFLKCDLDELPVLKKKRLVGMATLRQILERLDAYFAGIEYKHQIPQLGEVMRAHGFITPSQKLGSVLKLLEEVKPPIEVKDAGAVLGVLTKRELVHELYHEQKIISKIPAERVMSDHNVILEARRDVIAANSLMLDHTSYWTKIMKQDKIVGIITLREMFETLVELLKKHRSEERKK